MLVKVNLNFDLRGVTNQNQIDRNYTFFLLNSNPISQTGILAILQLLPHTKNEDNAHSRYSAYSGLNNYLICHGS